MLGSLWGKRLVRLSIAAVAAFVLVVIVWAPWRLTIPQYFMLRSPYIQTNRFTVEFAGLNQDQPLEGIQSLWLANGIFRAPPGRYRFFRARNTNPEIAVSNQPIIITPLPDSDVAERLVRFHPQEILNFQIGSGQMKGDARVSWFNGLEPPVADNGVKPGFTLVISLRTEGPVQFLVLSGKAEVFVEGVQISAGSKSLKAREEIRIVGSPMSLEEPYVIETLSGQDTTIHLQFVTAIERLPQIRMRGKTTRINAELERASMALRAEERFEFEEAKVTVLPDSGEFSFSANQEGLSLSAEGTSRGIWRSGRRLTLGLAALVIQKLGPLETLLGIIVVLLTPEIVGRVKRLVRLIWTGRTS